MRNYKDFLLRLPVDRPLLDVPHDQDLMISFSGGKTSALMTLLTLTAKPNAKVVFANTGQEHPKTIEFIKNFSDHFGVEVLVIEALVNPIKGKVTMYDIKDLDNLSMRGEPFEQVIKKYGIPNKGYPHCTRELKIQPIHSYAKANLSDKYYTAIGIRSDEIDRMAQKFREKRYQYPLIRLGITKTDVNEFWAQQPFNLDLEEKYGNCVTCWKKVESKLMAIIKENPQHFDFFREMEKKYSTSIEYRGPQYFFRGHTSVEALFAKAAAGEAGSDEPNACEESCEVNE